MKKFFMPALLAIMFGFCHSAIAQVEKTEYIGEWKTMKIVDDMDDSVRYVACAIPSRDWSKVTPENSSSVPGLFFISSPEGICNIKIPGASFAKDSYGQNPFFKYRLDKETPRTSNSWEGYEETLSRQKDVQQFAKELYGHKTLVVRTIDESGRQYTVKFNIIGAKEALKDIANAAGWK